MKIRKRLRFTIWVSLCAIILMALAIAWSFREIYRADRNMALASDMRQAAFDRIFLRDDYLLNPSERAKIQWYARSKALQVLLDSASKRFTHIEEQTLLQEARMNFDLTLSSFSGILEKHKAKVPAEGSRLAFAGEESRQISQIFIQAYALNETISRLLELSRSDAKKAQINGIVLIGLFVTAGVLAIVFNSILLNQILVHRITSLRKGVNIIGDGDLNYRINEEGEDELTDLARASNQMVGKLQASYTSIENLEQEMVQRKEAEEVAHRLNSELEQRVRERTAQHEVVNKELESFSYSISHDLRAPLRAIDGFSQALLEDYGENFDDTAKSYLDRVRKATHNMGRLIDDVLKLSRVTQLAICRETVDVSGMVTEISDKLQKSNHDREVEVVIEKGVLVNGDPHLIQIVIENLMENAWKFTSRTDNPKIELGTVINEGTMVCFIRDNGAGFDMTYGNKLFGAFQRLHSSEDFPGTGIGLATVQRVVNRHGGQVWAEAEVGKGATFYFTFCE
jgi:light-regulated signal transduction histidine kinase (bacteriophytochrome)